MACFPDVWAPNALSIFTMISSLVIGLVTIIGNLLIIVVVAVDPLKKLHTPFNYFLVNLAASDLIVGTFTMPISVYVHYKESEGHLDSFPIKLLHMSYFISASASLLSLIALSVDRYIAISWPIKYRCFLSWSKCIMTSILIWVLSLSIPFIYLKWGYINYLMFYANAAIVTSLIIMTGIYFRVYQVLRTQAMQMRRISRTSSTVAQELHLKRLLMEKKVTRTFLVILFFFACTYIPAIVLIYILHFCESCDCTVRHVFRDIQFLLVSVNSCVNPFICTIRLKHFHQSIKALVNKRKHSKSESDDKTGTTFVNESYLERGEIAVVETKAN